MGYTYRYRWLIPSRCFLIQQDKDTTKSWTFLIFILDKYIFLLVNNLYNQLFYLSLYRTKKHKAMATKKEIKEDAYFKTSNGRIGKAYAVTERKKENGIVDLFFEGSGSIVGIDNTPPSGMFKIESLTLVNKPKK